MQPETKFKSRVMRDLARLPRTWAEKIQQVGIRGTPDILLCVAGYFVALELKRDAKARTAPLQRHKLGQIRQSGGYAFLCHPGNWDETLKFIHTLTEEKSRGSQLREPA